MKNMKKLVSVVLTMIMVLAMGITAAAATITISGGAEGSEYAAYKLLDATDGGDGKFSYTVNEKYRSALQKVTGKTTDAEIVAYISELDDAGIRTFADAVYAEIKAMNADYTTTTDKFTSVDQGYYLIAETKTGSDQDSYSLVMLDTAGQADITVNTKESVPSLVKKVKDTNDSIGETSDWQDSADADVGDHVAFKLEGTVPSNYDSYKTYKYVFHDQMSSGLTFDKESVVVKVDGKEITTGYTVVTENLTDNCTFEVVFDDLKNIEDVHANSKITVEYTATLNEKAVLGAEGNPNKAKLEFSNNPYGEGTGETPWDKVIVFTYKTIINKVDKDGNALSGAEFTLEKFVKDENGKDTYKGQNGTWTLVKQVETTPGTTFTFSGLDDGYYRLTETTTPAGYNPIDAIYFEITATHDVDSADPKLTGLNGNLESGEITFTSDLTDGSLTTNVVNHSGTELPSTGGMGTTIFYVLGTILVLGAGVLLIARKRMKSEK